MSTGSPRNGHSRWPTRSVSAPGPGRNLDVNPALGPAPDRRAMLVGVLGVLVVEFALRNVLVPATATEAGVRLAVSLEWVLLAALLVWWVPRIEHGSWADIGFGPFRARYVWVGAGWFVAATVVSAGVGAGLNAVGLPSLADLQPALAGYAWPTLAALAVTGAVFEEVVYRGYLIERIVLLTGRIWVAATISWVAFTSMHLGFFGLGATLNAGVLSAALVWLYVRERNLWPVVVLHSLNSIFAYLLVPLMPAGAG